MFHGEKQNKIHWSNILVTFICKLVAQGLNGLKYVYSVISVIVNSLPLDTKNRQSTRSDTSAISIEIGIVSGVFNTVRRSHGLEDMCKPRSEIHGLKTCAKNAKSEQKA